MEYPRGDADFLEARQRPLSTDQTLPNQDAAFLEGRLSEMMWEAGRKQVKETFSSYGRIDIFRPYFDVDPRQVRNRLIRSLIPRQPSQMSVSADMYGPSMIVLTMVALLLFSMKSSGYVVQDGTLMGTAMLTCFSAWFFISLTISTLCYILSTDASSVHIFSLVGYSLFSHCIVIFMVTVFHPSHSHLFFYAMMIVFCVPSALRVSMYLCSKTRDKSHKLAMTVATFALHLGYLLYLHFGFHVMVEEIDEILGENTNIMSPLHATQPVIVSAL
uniref:Protein YIPF3 n=1 Tax=Ascaris suum TaxID=6253 RepID=F1L732_ASCSU